MLVCEGFDSAASFLPATWPGPGLYPAWDKAFHDVFDGKIEPKAALDALEKQTQAIMDQYYAR